MKLRILLAGLICGLVALAADTGGELYQKAITLEKADGNLKEAIQLYQRVAQEFSSDRALAAKALMQAAHCYELLGPGEQDKAIKIYEQVAREFGDQRQPAESARTKLASLRFEVASVKQVVLKPNEGYAIPRIIGGPGTSDPGRITFLNFSLNWLLRTAYGVEDYQLSEPDWLSSPGVIYVIEATVRPGVTKEQIGRMLQNLLADRFNLTLHRETRDLALYELTLLKKGPKLKESLRDPANDELPPMGKEEGFGAFYGLRKEKDGFLRLPSTIPTPGAGGPRSVAWATPPISHLVGGGQPIAVLANLLSAQSGRPVVDKTGLSGNWDYNLEFAQGASPANSPDAASDPAPDLIAAVRDQLGLKMDLKKGPIDVLVIDHVEKAPTAN
jgi:uncharacterized protein (TIGR03435 family)